MLQELLTQIPGMSAEDLSRFIPLWNKKLVLKRYDYLTAVGKTEDHLYFVKSGTLRICYPTEAEDICVGFAYSNTLVCSIASFLDQKPSEYFIQALKQTELTGISRTEFYRFKDSCPAFRDFWGREIEKALTGRIDREIDLLLPQPEERLKRLLQRSPHIFRLVPLKYIASYLRMSPETLSRISSKS